MTKNYTIPYLKVIVKKSKSIREVLSNLNMATAGGNYQTIKNKIAEYNIDTSHFTGQAWNKGKKLGPKRSLDEYLSNQKPIQSWKLKKRLLKEGLFESKCYNCFKDSWMDKPIPLELHHIDGNNTNNSLSNLSILCPNCHALTDNYRGKNK
jgi:hypothetical protein